MNTITEDRVREVLQHNSQFDCDDFAALTTSANADPEEGAEWLPYYKLSLAVLMQAFGMLDAMAHEILKLKTHQHGNKGRYRVLRNAEELARLSNRPCGIGPDESAEKAQEVDALNRKLWSETPIGNGDATT